MISGVGPGVSAVGRARSDTGFGAVASGIATVGSFGIVTAANVIVASGPGLSKAGFGAGRTMSAEGGSGSLASTVRTGATTVRRCDTTSRPARNARLTGILKFSRSPTGAFQIHELQLLDHQGKAVRPLAGGHEGRSVRSWRCTGPGLSRTNARQAVSRSAISAA